MSWVSKGKPKGNNTHPLPVSKGKPKGNIIHTSTASFTSADIIKHYVSMCQLCVNKSLHCLRKFGLGALLSRLPQGTLYKITVIIIIIIINSSHSSWRSLLTFPEHCRGS